MYRVTPPRTASKPAVRSSRRTITASASIATAKMLLWIVKKLKKFAVLNAVRSPVDAN